MFCQSNRTRAANSAWVSFMKVKPKTVKFLRKLVALNLIALFFGCNHENPNQLPALESLAFHFQDSIGMPDFISINSNENGAYITHFSPVYNQLHQIDIPRNNQESAYMISYIHETPSPYIQKHVKVLTFNDINKSLIETEPKEEFWYDYKKLTLTSSKKIEFFANGNAGNYYHRIENGQQEAYIELTVQAGVGPGKIVITKLEGEELYRFLAIENPLQLQADKLDISTFDQTAEIKRIPLADGIVNARIQIYSKFPDQDHKALLFDSYKNPLAHDSYIDFPFVQGDFDYFAFVQYWAEDGTTGFYLASGIPDEIDIPKMEVNIENDQFSNFRGKFEGAEMLTHSFEGELYYWHVFKDKENGFAINKPELAKEILDRFPELSAEGTWRSTNVVRFLPGNQMSYSDFVLPYKRFGDFIKINLNKAAHISDQKKIELQMRTFQ